MRAEKVIANEKTSGILRPAKASDFNFFLSIKSEAKNMFWSGHAKKPNKEILRDWFYKNLKSNTRAILIYVLESVPVGYAYVDSFEGHFETAVAVSEKFEGRGYGEDIVNKTIQYCRDISPGKPIFAWIFDKNYASIKIHRRAGYRRTNETKQAELGNGRTGIMSLYVYD